MSNQLKIGGKPKSVYSKLGSNAQKAQQPNRRVGQTQSPRVPTHEGSQLGNPSLAKVASSRLPADKQAQ